MKATRVPGIGGTASVTDDLARTIARMRGGSRAVVLDTPACAGIDAMRRARHAWFVVDVATTTARRAAMAQQAGVPA